MIAFEKTKTTFSEYAAMPESSQIIELIDGEIIVTSVVDRHSEFFTRLFGFLITTFKTGKLRAAPGGLYIDEHNSFEPDIFWISHSNTNCVLRPDERYWEGGPDLVVEILSSSTAYRDRGIKFRAYQSIGVREYWLADPSAQFIEVYVLRDGKFEQLGIFASGDKYVSSVLGVEIDVTPLFA
jgi:Uma2 family endonuclease